MSRLTLTQQISSDGMFCLLCLASPFIILGFTAKEVIYLDGYNTFEPRHDKTNKVVVRPSADSDQPGHPPSLVRLFAKCLTDS